MRLRSATILESGWSKLPPEPYAAQPARRTYIVGLVERLGLPKGSSIFEPGANLGANLAALAAAGYDAHGIDVNPKAVAQSKGRVSLMSFFDWASHPPAERIDLLLTSAFLMHLHPTYTKLIKKLPERARYILTVEDEVNMNARCWPRFYDQVWRENARQLWMEEPDPSLFGPNYRARAFETL